MKDPANSDAPSKAILAARLKQARTQLVDEDHLEDFARAIGLPLRTWLNYESGVTIPGEILLRFLTFTGVDLVWLIVGEGQPFNNATCKNRDPGDRQVFNQPSFASNNNINTDHYLN